MATALNRHDVERRQNLLVMGCRRGTGVGFQDDGRIQVACYDVIDNLGAPARSQAQVEFRKLRPKLTQGFNDNRFDDPCATPMRNGPRGMALSVVSATKLSNARSVMTAWA